MKEDVMMRKIQIQNVADLPRGWPRLHASKYVTAYRKPGLSPEPRFPCRWTDEFSRQHKTTDLNSKPTNCFLDRCCDLLNHFTILKFGCWIWLLLQRWEFIKQWSLLYFLFSGPGTWYKTWKTTVFLVFLFLCAPLNIEWTNSTRTVPMSSPLKFMLQDGFSKHINVCICCAHAGI